MGAPVKYFKRFFFPKNELTLARTELATSLGYYSRTHRDADVYVDSSASAAHEMALVSPADVTPRRYVGFGRHFMELPR